MLSHIFWVHPKTHAINTFTSPVHYSPFSNSFARGTSNLESVYPNRWCTFASLVLLSSSLLQAFRCIVPRT
eukprot:UN12772